MFDELFAAASVSSMIPAYDSSNRAVVERMASWARDLGCEVEVLAVDGAPGKYNLVATLGRGEGGLVFAGHTDTVPWDDALWRFDPLRATFDGDRVYGLGASDMKGFFALLFDALRWLDVKRLREPVIIVATADEESTMSGARALVARGAPRARHALIGEPTGMRPVRQHKGILMEAVRIVGHAGHSSDPALGANAIEGMHRVLGALIDWRADLQRDHRDDAFAVPIPTMNFGHVHGGDNPNRICAACDLQFDLRPLPGMDPDGLRAEFRARVEAALQGTPFGVEFTALLGGVPPLATAADAPIVRTVEALTGAEAGSVAFATEGPFLAQLMGDTVVLGPGDIAQAHQPDEYLAVARFNPMRELIGELVTRLCIDGR